MNSINGQFQKIILFIACTLRSLGDVYNDQGDYNETRKYYEKALDTQVSKK